MSKIALSIEDDDATYFLLQMAFHEVGGEFILSRALDGEQGLAFLRKNGRYANEPRPDLILLDLNLPRLSGLEVLATIQGDESLKDIPAVVFTSSKLDTDRARCLALGAKNFISKPYDFDGVMQAVRTACAHIVYEP